MRVLAIADAPPLVLPRAVDAVLWLGDLEPAWLDGLAELEVPKLGVHGNHDPPGRLADFGVRDVHLRQEPLGDLSVTGFQGSPRYRPDGGPFQVDADEAARLVARLPPSDVLISHAPPRGVNDEPGDVAHTGFPGLLAWVQEHQPRWLLHGHTQPRPFGATTRIGATRVVHVHGSALVELHPVT